MFGLVFMSHTFTF